jgi:hypothetical protein
MLRLNGFLSCPAALPALLWAPTLACDLGRWSLHGQPGRVGARPAPVGPDTTGDRAQSARPAGVRGGAVAVDRGADIRLAGALPTPQVGLRTTARDYRGYHSHYDNSTHAPQATRMNQLFNHPLRRAPCWPQFLPGSCPAKIGGIKIWNKYYNWPLSSSLH